jgi:hypothetical protein
MCGFFLYYDLLKTCQKGSLPRQHLPYHNVSSKRESAPKCTGFISGSDGYEDKATSIFIKTYENGELVDEVETVRKAFYGRCLRPGYPQCAALCFYP